MKLLNILSPLLALLVPISLSAQSSMSSLTDEQIAEIVQRANAAEIEAAQIARNKSTASVVKNYADQMISVHNENSKKLHDLQTKMNMKPAPTEAAKKVSMDAKNKVAELKTSKGAAFESAYIQSQVGMHQQLLNDLDSKFIPQAQNPEFKSFLQETRAHVQEHLTKAESIQTTTTK